MSDPLADIITIKQAAALLMLTEQWVRDLGRKGYITGIERASVPLAAAVHGYIKWLKDEERRTSKTSAQSRVQQARAKEIELRIAKEEGRLIEADKVDAIVANAFGCLRSEFSGVAAATSRDKDVREKIESLINDASDRARRKFEESMAALQADGDILLEDEETES
jgi:hypothetical protein